MATEPVEPDTDRWLDGLAGRSGEGEAHAEGERLRHALKPDAQAAAPTKLPWAEIEKRASSPGRTEAPGELETRAAANDGQWRPRYGWAAALLVAASVALVMQQREPGSRMRGDGSPAATWMVAEPAAAADGLAADLRALGATVTVQPDGRDLVLRIAADGSVAGLVNQRLAALETSLDGAGRLTLRVRDR